MTLYHANNTQIPSFAVLRGKDKATAPEPSPDPRGAYSPAAGMSRAPWPLQAAPWLPSRPPRCQHLSRPPGGRLHQEMWSPVSSTAGRIQFWNFKCVGVMYYKLYGLLASRTRLKRLEELEYRGTKQEGAEGVKTEVRKEMI